MEEESRGQAIGRRIRAIREEKMFSRRDIAERSGLSRAGLIKLEDGRVDQPRRTTLEKIARVLGVQPDYLILGEQPAPRPQAPRVTREGFAERGIEVNALEVATVNRMIEALLESEGVEKVAFAVPQIGGPDHGVDIDRVRGLLDYAVVSGILAPHEVGAIVQGMKAGLVEGR
jgi:transcriptional regulator with XRE-family HTH domain